MDIDTSLVQDVNNSDQPLHKFEAPIIIERNNIDIDTSMAQNVVIENQPIYEVQGANLQQNGIIPWHPMQETKLVQNVQNVVIPEPVEPEPLVKPNAKPKTKRNRTNFSMEQIIVLEKYFADKNYLNRALRIKISTELNLRERQVKIWFQNRRMKLKREQRESSAQKDSKKRSNSITDSRSSSRSSILSDRELCENLMRYQNFGRNKVQYLHSGNAQPMATIDYNCGINKVAQIECSHLGNVQSMASINYSHCDSHIISTQQQWQPTSIQTKPEGDMYPIADLQVYDTKLDIKGESIANGVHNFNFDKEYFQFDAPIFQTLGSLLN